MNKTARQKTCLIGLGQITQRYTEGLAKSDFLNLCAVADLNENAIGRKCYSQYPFYSDYKEMISLHSPSYVIISTPPESHFEIATYCLNNNINVIIEKPVTLCLAEFDVLRNLAREKNLVFKTLFHWHGGIETRAFSQKYKPSQIKEIKVKVCDPYSTDTETIDISRRPLMGAWIDSGVNVLSMIRQWLPFKELEIKDTAVRRCKESALPLYVKVNLLIDGVKTEITVDWQKGIDSKQSYIMIDNGWVHINHSEQTIEDAGKTEYARRPRLAEHYGCLFDELDGKSNDEFSRSVHEFLFKVNEVL